MLSALLNDLGDEQQGLDDILNALTPDQWTLDTPAEGWSIRDQVSHLAFSEELAGLALHDGEAFGRRLAELLGDLDRAEREPQERGRAMVPDALRGWWRDARAETIDGLRVRHDRDRVPWVTGEMSATSFATARLMETWAHGQDVVDAVGARRAPTARLRHIAHLGVATRAFSYQLNGLPVPVTPVRVELLAPDGDAWSWGPKDVADSVRGNAEDFCLIVTKRRHPADTDVVAVGRDASQWLSIAQAFAGPPGPGRG